MNSRRPSVQVIADIQESAVSWNEGPSLSILLNRPTPLLEMLARSPDAGPLSRLQVVLPVTREA